MVQDSQNTIPDAVEIINRFGGIRPMAVKTGIAVTTIQGWKQRNAVPLNRKADLLEAARNHNISLDGLIDDKPGSSASESASHPADKLKDIVYRVQTRNETADERDIRPSNNQVVFLAAGALLLASAILGIVLAITPQVSDITAQKMKVRELERQVEALKNEREDGGGDSVGIPEDYREKFETLQTQIGTLSEQAKGYTAMFEDLKTGTMGQRLAKLETHVNTLLQQANAAGLQNLVQKVQMMQASEGGSAQVETLVSAFAGAAVQTQDAESLNAAFEKLRRENPDIAATFEGVAPEDMKAAVMLVGMQQLRDSLSRDNNSFDSDLRLLKKTVAADDPKLQDAIDRLAPQAQYGVLTPQGLSGELKGLTGEIVTASLSGEDVSVKEKALARLGSIVRVEKDGRQVSGTDTQMIVAAAQKKLDAGDVPGAIALLQQIQGPAAQKTQPFIQRAEATMLADNVQQLLGQNLLLKLKGLGGGHVPYTGGGGLRQMMNDVQSLGAGR